MTIVVVVLYRIIVIIVDVEVVGLLVLMLKLTIEWRKYVSCIRKQCCSCGGCWR